MASADHLYALPAESEMALLPEWLRRGLNAFAVHSLFHTMNAFDLMRAPRCERHEEVEVARDISYGQGPHAKWRRLDVWRPRARAAAPRPTLVFVHGGGFTAMSRRTHWLFARAFARMGYVVFTIDYRLAPSNPFPSAIEDACEALAWILNHAPEHGADPQQLVLAGESAGANLVTSLALATCYRRPEPWARKVFTMGVTPRAVLTMSPLLQVSDPERFARAGASRLVMGPLRDARDAYLGPSAERPPSRALDFADPLVWLERGQAPDRPLPAFFAPVGTLDPLVDDARRLEAALAHLGAHGQVKSYRGGTHSFMAFMWNAKARECWRDMRAFLDAFAPVARGAHEEALGAGQRASHLAPRL